MATKMDKVFEECEQTDDIEYSESCGATIENYIVAAFFSSFGIEDDEFTFAQLSRRWGSIKKKMSREDKQNYPSLASAYKSAVKVYEKAMM